MRGSWLRVALLLAALSAGCKRSSPEAAAQASASAAPSALPPLVSAAQKPPPCRALRVKGEARADSGPVVTMTALDGQSWLDLSEGAEVLVRHGVTSREFSLRGPGRFLPCRGGTEQVLIASGHFKSAAGTGVRPGADFSVATPFGYLSYGDADLESSVETARWQFQVRRGDVATESVPGSEGLPGGRISGPNGSANVTGSPTAAKLVAHCERAAAEAHAAAERLLAADKAELGKGAVEQLAARRVARAACASAVAGLQRETDVEQRRRLDAQVVAAEHLWRTLPKRPRPAPSALSVP
jgi:hypothetical protein